MSKQLSFISEEAYKVEKRFKPMLDKEDRPNTITQLKPHKPIPKDYSWCPYCAKTIRLVKDKYLGVKRCPLCGISDRDMNMKKANSIIR